METVTLEQLLEVKPLQFCPISDLWEWSMNFNFPTPYSLFLDIIGYSEEELGERLCSENMPSLGYLEMDLLGKALATVGQYGQSAYDYATALVNAEMAENE